MSRTARRRIAALLSGVAMIVGTSVALTTAEAGTVNAGSCCTTRK
jgi:hypothetical protein